MRVSGKYFFNRDTLSGNIRLCNYTYKYLVSFSQVKTRYFSFYYLVCIRKFVQTWRVRKKCNNVRSLVWTCGGKRGCYGSIYKGLFVKKKVIAVTTHRLRSESPVVPPSSPRLGCSSVGQSRTRNSCHLLDESESETTIRKNGNTILIIMRYFTNWSLSGCAMSREE